MLALTVTTAEVAYAACVATEVNLTTYLLNQEIWQQQMAQTFL